MGFWHTGYFEFHEPSGLEGLVLEPSPPVFSCSQCSSTYASTEELRKHRFESHPTRKPTLYVHGREVGAHPLRITKKLTDTDVQIEQCESRKLR